MNQYLDYIMEQLEKLMAIDSPSGFTKKVTDYLLAIAQSVPLKAA